MGGVIRVMGKDDGLSALGWSSASDTMLRDRLIIEADGLESFWR